MSEEAQDRQQMITELKEKQAEFRAVRQRAEELEARIQHLIRQIDLSRPTETKSELEFETTKSDEALF